MRFESHTGFELSPIWATTPPASSCYPVRVSATARSLRDLRHVLRKRLLPVMNRGRIGEADWDDRRVERADRCEGAWMKFVNRIARERAALREGDHDVPLLHPAANLPKRGSAASAVVSVDEDGATVFRDPTEKRPVGHIVPAHQHTARQSQHHADVESALVIRNDESTAAELEVAVDQ